MQTTFACGRQADKSRKSKANSRYSILAIYSASVKAVSRSHGRSATASAAYRIAGKITDHRTGLIHDFTRKQGVESVSMHLPAGLSSMTSEALWNAAELAEKRKNSTVARELLVALPHELTVDQRSRLAARMAIELVQRYQIAAQVAVHLPDREGDNRNHHAHILFTTRRLNRFGLGEKTRELDDLKRGPEEVIWIREMVERCTNTALTAAGHDVRVDRRSLVEQRKAALSAGDQVLAHLLDRAPTLHEGPRVTQIRRECTRFSRTPMGLLDRAAVNDDIHTLLKSRLQLVVLNAQIIDLDAERAKRRPRAYEQRLYWLENELSTIQSAEGRLSDLGRRVCAGIEQRLAQARTDVSAPVSHSIEAEWLARLWRGEVIQELKSSPIMDQSSKRRLAEMLNFPLPEGDTERRQQWLMLLEEVQRAESANFGAAEQHYETQSYTDGSPSRVESEDLSLWYSVRQMRLDAIDAALCMAQTSSAHGRDVRSMVSALQGLRAEIQALTPENLSVAGMQEAVASERDEFLRLPEWLKQRQSLSPDLRPSGPRLG
ncbi:MobA/MobL family protein [Pseudomonas sp. IT-P4]|uniref:MobA/MobL family protein n=1 Tax=Pseudomonas sp. IT-P4 TaxID=3026446 RepID=UPI0039DFE43B